MLKTAVRTCAITLAMLLGACGSAVVNPLTYDSPKRVTVIIVRHAETDQSQPATLPLSKEGRARAEQLAATVRGIQFTHLLATHTVRSKQMLDAIGSTNGVEVVQLPRPGTLFEGQLVTDQTSRRAPIEPISRAVLSLPPGSVALLALNSENIYAILHKLGIPQVAAGQECRRGQTCVPCIDNSCYPRNEFDHLWHLVLQPGAGAPVSFTELRYGAGWKYRAE